MFWLFIILSIVFVLYAAFKYLTAAGEPNEVNAAGRILLYAAVAIVVALIAKGLPLIVSGFIGGGLTSNGCGGGSAPINRPIVIPPPVLQ